LHHITKETFEFQPDEIIKYYQLFGVRIQKQQAEQLYALSEGWISALYLMMLGYLDEGSFTSSTNIYKLVEKSVYQPLREQAKEFLLSICMFDCFTLEQAAFVWQKEDVGEILAEITGQNAFVEYDPKTKAYQIHNILSKFIKEVFETRETTYKKQLYERAASFYKSTGEYHSAMSLFYLSGNFDSLLDTLELGSSHHIYNKEKDFFIQCFEECPQKIKNRHPVALLVYALRLFSFNELALFKKACDQFIIAMNSNVDLDPENRNSLMGEFEVVLSFTEYNNITKMSEHHRKACALINGQAKCMNPKGGWTLGSPSVLYMFYRVAGKLENQVQVIKESMPFYYQITGGHGMGAEFVMEAEWYFNRGDLENAEITVHKALYKSSEYEQAELMVCSMFLQARICLFKSDDSYMLYTFQRMHEVMTEKTSYFVMHTIELCEAFIYASLKLDKKIPQWIAQGDFHSSRLFFPAKPFSNIVFGRVMLINGEYLKLLGMAEQFIAMASVFPNLLGQIYTYIYAAASNYKIFRREEALDCLKQALDIAMPDDVYMPFVEKCDFILPLLEQLRTDYIYREGIGRILVLYEGYRQAATKIVGTYFSTINQN
jgi:LuxR family maltose regulon positive regulatory protein